jgi:hypothetical protein
LKYHLVVNPIATDSVAMNPNERFQEIDERRPIRQGDISTDGYTLWFTPCLLIYRLISKSQKCCPTEWNHLWERLGDVLATLQADAGK